MFYTALHILLKFVIPSSRYLIHFELKKLIISMTTQVKHGEVLERIVRRDSMGISELSRKLNVSRRTIYNWFNKERLSYEVIWQVGDLLGQDLSPCFPDIFQHGNLDSQDSQALNRQSNKEPDSVYFWMNKYIQLLEKYNDLLSSSAGKELEEQNPKNLSPRSKRPDTFLYQ